jgi:hypothetical protein
LGQRKNPPARLFGLHVGTRGRRDNGHAIAARGRNRDCHARIGAWWSDHAFVPGELAGQSFSRPGVRDGLDLTGSRRGLARLLSFGGRARARCGEPCDTAKAGFHPKRNNFAHSGPLSFEETGRIALCSLPLGRSGASFDAKHRRRIEAGQSLNHSAGAAITSSLPRVSAQVASALKKMSVPIPPETSSTVSNPPCR